MSLETLIGLAQAGADGGRGRVFEKGRQQKGYKSRRRMDQCETGRRTQLRNDLPCHFLNAG